MKKALKLFVCSFLLLGVFGCSNSNDQSNTKSDKKDTEVKEETNKADDKNTINTKDDIKTTATLEEKYNQLQKALEKEDGYVVDDQLSYKEDEAEGLKYTQCIEKNTNSSYEIYSKAVYYNEDSAKSSESQWNETKTTSDGKTVGITYNEEKEATYYYYRDGNVIISAGGYGANDQVLNNLKKYYSLEIQ